MGKTKRKKYDKKEHGENCLCKKCRRNNNALSRKRYRSNIIINSSEICNNDAYLDSLKEWKAIE